MKHEIEFFFQLYGQVSVMVDGNWQFKCDAAHVKYVLQDVSKRLHNEYLNDNTCFSVSDRQLKKLSEHRFIKSYNSK